LSRAQYSQEQTQVKINGYWVPQEYGEFIYGRTAWSDRLKIPEQQLRTIMKRLEKDNMIINTKKSTPRCSVFLVVNYAKFNQRTNQPINQLNPLETQEFYGNANQPINQLTNQRTTSEQPATNQRLTTIKKEKIDNTGKKDKKEEELSSNNSYSNEQLDAYINPENVYINPENDYINSKSEVNKIEGDGEKKKTRERKKVYIVEENAKSAYGSQNNVMMTFDELERLRIDFPEYADSAIEYFSKYIAEKDYKSKSHNLAIRRWVIDACKKQNANGLNQKTQTFGKTEAERIRSL